jgi:hypothetical protein
MKIKTTLAVIALMLAPGMASAYCSGDKMKDETAASCAAGSTWDAATSACVPSTTS